MVVERNENREVIKILTQYYLCQRFPSLANFFMIRELQNLNDLIFKMLDTQVSEITPDLECEEYFGHIFKIGEFNIKFRKSKLTPNKIGQFVTLWKRDCDGKTIPFEIDDNFQFYIIALEENDDEGFFIFPKSILEKNHILSNKGKGGKRGFRVYADWHFPNNKQAEKTKIWQTEYFTNYSEPKKNSRKVQKNLTTFLRSISHNHIFSCGAVSYHCPRKDIISKPCRTQQRADFFA